MLSKCLLMAGRVAPPLVEYAMTSQPQFPPPAPTMVPFIPMYFEAPQMPSTTTMPSTPSSPPTMVGSTGGVHATRPLLAPRARPGDWVCVCGFSNFASRNACFGCQRPRTDTRTTSGGAASVQLKPGDWSCPCGTHNFARRTTCMTCDAPKPTVASYPSTTHERILPGDWLCSQCNAHNFRSRAACVKCGEKKSATPTPASTLGIPWTCAACHTANLSARKDCEICGVSRPNDAFRSMTHNVGAMPSEKVVGQSVSSFSSAPRAGDWSCSQCSFVNFGSRQVCKSCSSPRPEEAGAASTRTPQEIKKGDWACSCGYHNFARRHRCFECQLPRPAVEATTTSSTVPPTEDA